MTRVLFPVFFLAACGPVEAVVSEPDWARGASDLGTFDDGSGDLDDINDDGSLDDPAGNDDPIPLIWDGTRDITFAFEAVCSETLEEEGFEVTYDPSYASLVESCEKCDHVFEVHVTPDAICWDQVNIASKTFRGIEWDGDKARMFTFGQDESGNWRAKPLANGQVKGAALEYWYEGWWDGWAYYEVSGRVVAHE
jgi:hypothetical protein